MTARDDILDAARSGAAAAVALPRVPDFCSSPADLVGLFTAALARLDGKVISQPPSGIQQWLSTAFPGTHRVYSAIGEVTGTVDGAEFEDWGAPADIDITVGADTARCRRDRVNPAHRKRDRGIHRCGASRTFGRAARSGRHCRESPSCLSQPGVPGGLLCGAAVGTIGLWDIGGVTIHPAQGVTTLTVVLSPRQSSDAPSLAPAANVRVRQEQ